MVRLRIEHNSLEAFLSGSVVTVVHHILYSIQTVCASVGRFDQDRTPFPQPRTKETLLSTERE